MPQIVKFSSSILAVFPELKMSLKSIEMKTLITSGVWPKIKRIIMRSIVTSFNEKFMYMKHERTSLSYRTSYLQYDYLLIMEI